MANRNKQPFYDGGNPSFPLGTTPYFSRVEAQRVGFEGGTDINRARNYQSVAFRPGFSLQASELNEIQEHFQMQLTLSIAMMNNWITSGGGFMWNGANPNTPSGVGGGSENEYSYPTSIGLGGVLDGDDATHNDAYQITAPGWRGTTPLYPYSNPWPEGEGPDDNNNHGPRGSLVRARYDTAAGGTVRIEFYSGWYLTELRPINTTEPGRWSGISGLKHWVYLDTDTDATYSQNFSVDVPVGGNSSNDVVVGLIVTAQTIGCEGVGGDLDPFDPDLADNAAGLPNSASCGASRYAVNFQSAAMYQPDLNDGSYNNNERDQISLCVKVNALNKTVRYMNNQILYTW